MFTIYLIIFGVFIFAVSVLILGLWLRKNPTKENAERSSRVLHLLFFAGYGAPITLGVFTPGLTRLDQIIGLGPLPFKTLFIFLGILLAIPGLYFMVVTNIFLRTLGSGANAFRLTKKIVAQDIYKRTRNPMSLGYYLLLIALGFVLDSTFLTLVVALGMIPAHLFFLKYFEERELELRFGKSYMEYKREVPFLIPSFKRSS
jgi:protein-S-isoprenylcysteine O-methyltransferase Ste14